MSLRSVLRMCQPSCLQKVLGNSEVERRPTNSKNFSVFKRVVTVSSGMPPEDDKRNTSLSHIHPPMCLFGDLPQTNDCVYPWTLEREARETETGTAPDQRRTDGLENEPTRNTHIGQFADNQLTPRATTKIQTCRLYNNKLRL